MRAAVLKAYNPVPSAAAVSVVSDFPIPRPKPGEIIVKVARAACNPGDVKIVEGGVPRFIFNPKLPVSIGIDFAGVVYDIPFGSESGDLRVGDRVCGLTEVIDGQSGAFAEYVACKPKSLCKIPSDFSFDEAAAMPLVSNCARAAVIKAKLEPGHNFLVFGGSSAIGLLSMAMAKDIGCKQIVCTSTAERLCKSFGATKVINYREVDPVKVLTVGADEPQFDRSFDTAQGYGAWLAAKKLVKKSGWHSTIVIDDPKAPPHVTSSVKTIVGIACSALGRAIAGSCCGGPGYSFLALKGGDTPTNVKYFISLRQSGVMPSILDSSVGPFSFDTEGVVAMLQKQQSGSCKGKLVVNICPEMT